MRYSCASYCSDSYSLSFIIISSSFCRWNSLNNQAFFFSSSNLANISRFSLIALRASSLSRSISSYSYIYLVSLVWSSFIIIFSPFVKLALVNTYFDKCSTNFSSLLCSSLNTPSSFCSIFFSSSAQNEMLFLLSEISPKLAVFSKLLPSFSSSSAPFFLFPGYSVKNANLLSWGASLSSSKSVRKDDLESNNSSSS